MSRNERRSAGRGSAPCDAGRLQWAGTYPGAEGASADPSRPSRPPIMRVGPDKFAERSTSERRSSSLSRRSALDAGCGTLTHAALPASRMPQGLTACVDQHTSDYRNVTPPPLTALPSNIMNSESGVANSSAQVHFTQDGSRLKVEIVRDRRSPVIASLHRALFTLGVIVASYQVVSGTMGLVERMVLERNDGGVIDAELSAATQAAILPIALGSTGVAGA